MNIFFIPCQDRLWRFNVFNWILSWTNWCLVAWLAYTRYSSCYTWLAYVVVTSKTTVRGIIALIINVNCWIKFSNNFFIVILQVVEQAAASILDLAGRTSPLSESTISGETKKFGDIGFLPSLIRLLKNKILMCCIFASVFCTVGLLNFVGNEDIFLESRFYVPRPSGLLLGFGDPLTSRIVSLMLRPIIIGLVIIISGIVIVKLRPRAKWCMCYNIIIGSLAAMIIFSLAFASCQKPPISGLNQDGS